MVACGTLIEEKDDSVVLADARCAVYWAAPTKSLFGLASHGPDKESRISRPCKIVKIRNVETLIDVSDKAYQAWCAEPWHQ
jgi:hypothetical protein